MGVPSTLSKLQPPPQDNERKTPLLDVKRPDRYLRELVLAEEVSDLLLKTMREFRQWDILEANGLWPNSKLLFCGPPGCGKTAAAEAIAAELSLPLVYVRFDSVVSSLLGETASNIRKVFDYISQDTWVVLFDEFDAIGRSRDDLTEHGEIKRVVNSFLQMLDNFQGQSLIIAATNFEQVLDPALWRRFDEIVRFEIPTVSQIGELMTKRLYHANKSNISVNKYARRLQGSTYADVERVCTDVLKTCALDGKRKLQAHDIGAAVKSQELRRQMVEKSITSMTPKVDTA